MTKWPLSTNVAMKAFNGLLSMFWRLQGRHGIYDLKIVVNLTIQLSN